MDKITDRLNLFILLAEAFIPSTATALLPSPMFSARILMRTPTSSWPRAIYKSQKIPIFSFLFCKFWLGPILDSTLPCPKRHEKLTFIDISTPLTSIPGILLYQEEAKLRLTKSSRFMGSKILTSNGVASRFRTVLKKECQKNKSEKVKSCLWIIL